MKRLVAIGFWNDGSDDCPLHNPQEFIDARCDASLRETLFHYLRSGTIVRQYLGHSWCRFECGVDESAMGSAELSDGVWLWPEGLAHYVARHAVRLPDEFVEHARASGFRAPRVEPPQELVADISFWADWSDAHTNGDPEAQALWRRTPEEIEATERSILDGLLEKHGGLSEEPCQWAGCEQRALRALAFCPACAHQRMNNWP